MTTLAEILPEARRLPARDKIRLIRFLADDLETTEEAIFPLEPHKIYYLPTPYNLFGVAEGLMNALNAADTHKPLLLCDTNTH